MSYLYTVGGYATLIGVGYALYHVSTHKANRRTAPAAPRGAKPSHQEPRKEDRKKKQRMESFASEVQEAAKEKPRDKTAEEHSTQSRPVPNDKSDDGADNREFARQLAKAQEGTKFAAKAEGAKQREKSVKQSRANQISNRVAEDKLSVPSAPSSTTGADADDDQSPPSSPQTPPADVSGVSDMLEPTPAGPSVLRVTGAEPQKQKSKPAKAPEKTESKKQRQNRKKAEAAKAAREESEKERKTLEEKQRRAARIAEGRAAKDGSLFQAAKPASSAWIQGAPNGASAGQTPDAGVLHQPLDTQVKAVPTAVKQQSATEPPSGAKSESSWISSLPSEEVQMEMLKDEADDWNTVTTKSSKKAAKKAPSVSSGDEKVQTQPAAQPKQLAASTNKSPPKAPAPQNFGGSFSALTNDEGPEEEEEWDV
ncbi:hypothetical protein HRG_005917 [Hirsutella rhossiliensis]|uniref:Uncharacterized protein n=1 Tax=Hirsutella rhossiliensis TaxID=111463 RepID=A0A9P8MY03_9HYPO|nr:uncharacterized protein HRG_05917 [Hirsutella rhossiliensis]KAH0963407.1 hypothetical protein HRG_05917 [Hirsutella rhossiliensis]